MRKEEISELIGKFYNNHPFPGFDSNRYKNKESLYYGANIYGRLLADQIPENTSIIDFGCGTGRISLLLGIKNRKVLGIDISNKSLEIANKLKNKLGFDNVTFIKQDIFELNIPFMADYIISIGVLHHTYNIEKSFAEVVRYLKPNGYVIIGLYNSYGRLLTKVLRLLNKSSFNLIEKFDFYINNVAESKNEKEMWKYDMYHCQHELVITIDGVLNMFKKNNIEYINSFPNNITGNDDFPRECTKLFNKKSEGTKFERTITQLKWILSEYKAGGLFMMIGRKK